MNSLSPQNIILKPIITEKTLAHQEVGQYSFWVNRYSNKNQIAEAFKMVFSIEPIRVNTYIIKGKLKTDWRKKKAINKPDRKKAVILIKKDQKIELLTLKTK
jgi:large subunit ribosomal protein L23